VWEKRKGKKADEDEMTDLSRRDGGGGGNVESRGRRWDLHLRKTPKSLLDLVVSVLLLADDSNGLNDLSERSDDSSSFFRESSGSSDSYSEGEHVAIEGSLEELVDLAVRWNCEAEARQRSQSSERERVAREGREKEVRFPAFRAPTAEAIEKADLRVASTVSWEGWTWVGRRGDRSVDMVVESGFWLVWKGKEVGVREKRREGGEREGGTKEIESTSSDDDWKGPSRRKGIFFLTFRIDSCRLLQLT